VQNRLDPVQAVVEPTGIIEGKDTMRQTQLAGQGFDRLTPPAGENRAQTTRHRLPGDQLTGKSVGAVNQAVAAGHARNPLAP
jgi:hypothetical protein